MIPIRDIILLEAVNISRLIMVRVQIRTTEDFKIEDRKVTLANFSMDLVVAL